MAAHSSDQISISDRSQAGAPFAGTSRLLLAIVVIATIGFGIAAYLTYEHYAGLGGLLCLGARSGHSSCATVQSSSYSEIAGVSVAVLGLIGYAGILGSLLIRGELGRALGFAIALVGFAFSAYLTYRELFTIHAICEWCVTSAVCMTILAVLTAVRFLRAEPDS
jgi:uncharacterized membrane protein